MQRQITAWLSVTFFMLLMAPVQVLAQGEYASSCSRSWSPQETPVITLSGDWCITHQQTQSLARVPGLWQSSTHDNLTIPGTATVTYRYRIEHGVIDQPLMLRLPRPYERYRVMVNQQAISPDGMVKYFDKRQPNYWQFNTSGTRTDLLIEVSNRRFISGGLREAPEFGLAVEMNRSRLQNLALEAVQSGLLLLMAFILFAQYAAMRRHYSAGIFYGLTCLGVAIFAGLGGEQWLSLVLGPLGIYPELYWRWAMIAISVLGLSEFTRKLYPAEFWVPIGITWRAITGLFLLACLLMPARMLAWTFWGLEFLALLISLYLVSIIFVAAWRGRDNALSTAVLYGLLFVAVAHDILTDLSGQYAGNFGPTAMVLCLVGQGLVLARQNARAHINSLNLVERLERAEKVKDEFLANTSHELRTPLQTIIGLASAEPIRNPRLISDTAKRLALLVDDLMDLTRMRHQGIQLSLEPVNVQSELTTLQQLFLPLIQHRDLKLSLDVSDPTLSVFADPRRLRQVLYNLLGNAVKFTLRGEITLYARVTADGVSLGVRDTGPGMVADHARYQLKQHQTDSSGLGLPISQGILEAHGASLQIISSNQGTDASFTLSKAEATRIEPQPQRSEPDAASIESDDYILILDDDGAVLESLEQMLTPLNLRVERESRVDRALSRMGQRLPSLLILDLMMPRISGFEVLQALRQQYDSHTLPILVLTARHGQEDQRRALTMGANDYAVKPCEALELVERCRAQLHRTHPAENARELTVLSEEMKLSPRPIALVDAEENLLDANPSGHSAFMKDPSAAELRLPFGRNRLLLWPVQSLPDEPRTLLVTSLQQAFAAWQQRGGNRASLAEKSRQWRVQLDGSTARSRTFDRYFSLATLPKRPKVDKVLNTLRFVAREIPEADNELNERLQKLEQLRNQDRQAFNS